MDNITIDATPDKSLIKKLGMVGYRTEQAVAELIDNSIDARIGETRLDVKIRFDHSDHEITIEDDGCGMSLEELQDAWTIARSTDGSQRRLGRFGIGMKSACSALGGMFTISTTAQGADKELVLKYDEVQWLQDDDAGWSNIVIEQHDTDKKTHGTVIRISKTSIPMYSTQAKNFVDRFSTRYGPYISSGEIRIVINGKECVAKDPEIKKGSRESIKILTLEGHVIKGWIGLLKQRSIKGDYGIHLYREGRLIEAYAKFGIPRHPSAARIVGELYLDHVPVNVFKTKFLEESNEYRTALGLFMSNMIVRHVLKLAAERKYKSGNHESILNLQDPKKASRIMRVGDSGAQEILDKFESITINSKSGKMIMSLDDLESGIYEVERRNNVTKIIVNKNSGVFRAFRNPLFFLMMIRLEVEKALGDESLIEFVRTRNEKWEQYISKLAGVKMDRTTMRHTQDSMQSYDLEEIRKYVSNAFSQKFQFTAMSTLSMHLHNAYNKMVYTVYTEDGAGYVLKEVLEEMQSEYQGCVVLLKPNKTQLDSTLKMTSMNKIIVIREYTSVPSSNTATPEKSWVDLYFEVTRKGLWLYESELKMVRSLISEKLVNEEKIKAYAKRRRIDKDVSDYIEDLK